jgi:hypothetical protein
MAKGPTQVPPRVPLMETQILSATYLGSAEHKQHAWWGGLPQGNVGADGKATRPKKQMTTICPLTESAERDTATDWVRQAIRLGQLRFFEGDKDFPRYVWYRDGLGRV